MCSNRQETNGGAQALGVGGDGIIRVSETERNRMFVDFIAGILQCQFGDGLGCGTVKTTWKYGTGRQDRPGTFGQPAVSTRHGLAFWAIATAARIIQDDAVPAVVLFDAAA